MCQVNSGWLVGFYGISTIVVYSMPNPIYTYVVPSISFQIFLNKHLKLSETLNNSVCYCYSSYEMTHQFLWFSGSNEQLQQQLEYTLLNPDCHSWWISKMQSGHEDPLEERYAIKFCFKLGKKGQRNVWNVSDCFLTILHESSISFWVA